MRLIHLDNTTKKKKINSDMDVLQCFWKWYLNRALTQLEGFLSASGDRGTFMGCWKKLEPQKAHSGVCSQIQGRPKQMQDLT